MSALPGCRQLTCSLHSTSQQLDDYQHQGSRSPVNQNGRLEDSARVLEDY